MDFPGYTNLTSHSDQQLAPDSPCYALAEFLHKILSPLAGNTGSFVKDSEHFIKSTEDINLQNERYLASFDIVSLFTNVPMEEVLQVIGNQCGSFFPRKLAFTS
jgi:hypothetical protein